MNIGVGSTTGVAALFPLGSNIDIETLLLSVQMQRANLIDQQLAAKIEAVKAKNDQIAKLNDVLSALTAANNAFKSDAKAGDKFNQPSPYTLEKAVNDAIKAAGLSDMGFDVKSTEKYSDSAGAHSGPSTTFMNNNTTKGQVDSAIQKVKGMLDSANNNSQMDMLELQSLTNKRNDAYDLMTNFVKKMADSRSTILANLR